MKKFKIFLIVFGGFIGLLILGATVMFIGLSSNMKKINAIEVSDIDFRDLEDGEYVGEYYYERQIGATVSITVENGEVIQIEFIDHVYGLGGKAEIITDHIISEQSLLVDDIAGATTSSHIIKLAIENALEEE